jgi:hypothetical protein
MAEGDVDVHFAAPGSGQLMNVDHGGDGGGCGAAVAITFVAEGGSKGALLKAVLTGVAVAEEESTGAEEAEVVECLYDRDAEAADGVVGGGRNEGEGVVEVGDVGFAVDRGGADGLIGTAVPNGRCSREKAVLDSGVILLMRDHTMAALFEQVRLGGECAIFAARLFIEIMEAQHLHSAAILIAPQTASFPD